MAQRRITRSMSKKARLEESDPDDTSTQHKALDPSPGTSTLDAKKARLGNDDDAESDKNPCFLNRLPNEILLKIGNYLPIPDLSNLSRLNKRLFNIFGRGPENEKYKRMLREFNLTRSSVIEETVACK